MYGVMFGTHFVDESSSTTPRTAQLIFANFLTAKYYVIPHAFLKTISPNCAQVVFELAYEYW